MDYLVTFNVLPQKAFEVVLSLPDFSQLDLLISVSQEQPVLRA